MKFKFSLKNWKTLTSIYKQNSKPKRKMNLVNIIQVEIAELAFSKAHFNLDPHG